MTASARVAVVSAGTSAPSSTRLLADRIGTKVTDILTSDSITATSVAIELAPLAADMAAALVGGLPSDRLRSAKETLAAADVVVLSTPVYKAGLSGLFKSFIDVLDDDLVVGKVVVLAAAKLTQSKEKLVASPNMAWAADFSPGMLNMIGSLEVLAAVGLILPAALDIVPTLVPVAAAGLGLLMIGAATTHARRGEISNVVVNVVLLALAVVVVWGRVGPESFS